MDMDFGAFHFLRPLWLLLILPGVILPLVWSRRHDLVRQLDGIVAPHLLQNLLITPRDEQRLRPVHLLAALLILGAVAAAGPTWQQDRPAFLDNRAPLILALDLSPSMDATDVPPSRLAAARHKLHDLIQRRAGARTALIAYAGSAHLVLPATDDPTLLDTFLQSLSTGLIDSAGKDALGVIDQARKLLEAERSPGTLVLLTDGADASQFEQIGKRLEGSGLQVLVLAVGSQDGGVLRDEHGQPRVGSDGRPLLGSFDADAVKALADAADAPLGSLTLNDDDLDWIELHAQQHFEATSGDGRQVHWKDAGYWLCWPLLLIALFCARRGWRVHWLAGLLLAVALGMPAAPAHAGALADAFFTPDQQGRWAFEHQHYPQAAAHFSDPYWKGLAAYQAADFDAALASFARLESAPAYFYLGNTYVRLSKFPEAIEAYRKALRLQPDFPQASANLALAEALEKDREDQQEAGPPDEKADKVDFDNKADKGKSVEQKTAQASSEQLWLDNLSTSPARFLKRKFQLQDAARRQPAGGTP
ncbi:VWA domain-containing protein [Pseudomonas schmalbachii]|uniref:VWA domain-containing protein n=1 Tax=Pseudomonas schmalbachii TaxID=2816993 RepID=A0ABS3TMC2_9PSED|nr:VWA domain-containing protein [Pseudomonas schmalbachii]MBO3273840.1 VWA domain-containing protein [Pseudomonas schmalbachii]